VTCSVFRICMAWHLLSFFSIYKEAFKMFDLHEYDRLWEYLDIMEYAISWFCRMINVCHVFYIMIKGLHDGIVMMFVFFVGFLLQWFLESWDSFFIYTYGYLLLFVSNIILLLLTTISSWSWCHGYDLYI